MNKHHIFDLDGTLVNSMSRWAEVMIKILDEEKLEYPENIINILTPLGYQKTAEYIKNLGANYTVEEIFAKIEKYCVYAYSNLIEMKPFVVDYLNKLKGEGCKLYVLTASPHAMTDVCLKHWGVYDMFDIVWSSDELGLPKSDPAIYPKAASIMGADVSEIVFYDDNLAAITAATKAGLHTVAVYDETSLNDRETLKEIATEYIDSFKDLL